MTSLELQVAMQAEVLRIEALNPKYLAPVKRDVVSVWRVKCVFPTTSITLKINAKSTNDAVDAAKRSRFGKHATSYVVLGTEGAV